MTKEIKKQSLGEVSVILVSLVKIGEYFGELWRKIRKYRLERRQKKLYREAEKAFKDKDVKKIQDIFRN